MKLRKEVWIILGILFFAKIMLLFKTYHPWWDSAVYLGMGKSIFTLGKAGLWEPIRPLVWPLVLGLFWKLGTPIWLGRILEIFLSLGITLLTYLIGKKIFSHRTGLISAAMISAITFLISLKMYAGIPAVFLVLLSFYLILENKHLSAGVFLGLAFMTKFTAGIFLICFAPLFIRKIREGIIFGAGFLVPVIHFFILNQILYGNFIFPFMQANEVIRSVMSCNYLRFNPWYFYFIALVKDNVLYLASILGLFYIGRKFNKEKLVIALSFLIPLIYFTSLHCRIDRYMILFIPFAAIISGYGMSRIKLKHLWAAVLILSLIISGYTLAKEEYLENPASIGYYSAEPEGEIWVSNPMVALYSDKKLNLLYYPVYNDGQSGWFYDYLTTGQPDMVYMDNCGGGIICATEVCQNNLNMTLEYLDQNFKLVYDESYGRCYYKIWQSSSI